MRANMWLLWNLWREEQMVSGKIRMRGCDIGLELTVVVDENMNSEMMSFSF